MRVAFCFSGLTRVLDNSKDFWLKQIEKYNADVFGSFWDDNLSEVEVFNKLFKPKRFEIENYEILKSTTFDYINNEVEPPQWLGHNAAVGCKNGNVFSMWYKIWRCNLLTKQYPEYDIVVRCRLDNVLDDSFVIEQNDMLNIPMGFTEIKGHSLGPNDMLAYGSVPLMDYYCTLFMKLQGYLREAHAYMPPENLLRVHLSEQNIRLNTFKSYIYVTRNMEIAFNYYASSNNSMETKSLVIPLNIENTYYKKHEINFTQG
jgi:hypothetical protein